MKHTLPTLSFPSAPAFLDIHGDAIWLEICDEIMEDTFCPRDIVDRITYLKRFKHTQRLRYLRLVLTNVAYTAKNVRSLDAAVSKLTGQVYQWESN